LAINRVKSGVQGLDQIVGGGIPRESVVLLSGGPGSGKTTLGLQILVGGAEKLDENGVFVTLTETPDDIRKEASAFGWNFKKLEDEGKLRIVDARPTQFVEAKQRAEEVGTFSSWLWGIIEKNVKEIDAKRVVVDSINVLTSQFADEYRARQAMTALVEALHQIPACTSFIIFEQISSERSREEFLTQGVIILHYIPVKNGMMRAIQVLKMRRTAHSENFHPFEVAVDGIKVNAEETAMFF
jgi:KaiC/GvpD/RAD55 family RecA-like ATPase